ncbi:hypothetical protein BDZ89DRAFT_1057796 [Hymenopellis radicata]|nr:hypothetical protein BDZ89DRAFT_1057796 [Hymenopellis radicata]
MDAADLAENLTGVCATFDINVQSTHDSLCTTLDAIAEQLARNQDLRASLGSATPSPWPCLRKLWQSLHRAQLTFWDGDDSDGNDGGPAQSESQKHHHLLKLGLSLARFTRNLVAGVPENQNRAFENETDIRRLLHYYTSWTAMEDQQAVAVARVLAQALSNIITANDSLMQSLWETYMNLPEDQVVLIRLLTSSDAKSALPALMLIQNCIQGSRTRARLLVRTTVGARLCVCLLDKMASTYEAEEGTDDANAFDIGYAIFSRLLEAGLVPEMYAKLSIKDETVTPHQTVILKLVDSYLQATPMAGKDVETFNLRQSLSQLLGSCFFALSSYSQRALRRALGSPSTETFPQNGAPAELDVMLPRFTLLLDDERDPSTPNPNTPQPPLKTFFNSLRSESHRLDESLVEVLRLLDRFLPRINFGKAVPVVGAEASSSAQPTDTGFSYLKRDLVRLLGVLCHENRAVQDRIRECGGIEVVMNLCVVDERNPYLREHAIFTLHNLLKGNAENQSLVQEIQPASQWDEDGVLRDTPGAAVRK